MPTNERVLKEVCDERTTRVLDSIDSIKRDLEQTIIANYKVLGKLEEKMDSLDGMKSRFFEKFNEHKADTDAHGNKENRKAIEKINVKLWGGLIAIIGLLLKVVYSLLSANIKIG